MVLEVNINGLFMPNITFDENGDIKIESICKILISEEKELFE